MDAHAAARAKQERDGTWGQPTGCLPAPPGYAGAWWGFPEAEGSAQAGEGGAATGQAAAGPIATQPATYAQATQGSMNQWLVPKDGGGHGP